MPHITITGYTKALKMASPRKLIDLSLTIDTTVSEPAAVSIEYVSHRQGAEILGKPLQLKAEDWPDGMALSTETVSLTSHTGTHVDAPVHYGPYCGGGPSKTVEELPLEWFYQDGVMIFVPTKKRAILYLSVTSKG
jgi:cyclase